MANFTGDDGPNLFGGTPRADVAVGLNGGDTLSGRQGNDTLFGNGGLDELRGDGGRDTLDGGNSRDVLFGGADSDHLSGGNGADTLIGGIGRDTLVGGRGPDTFVFSADDTGGPFRSDLIADLKRDDVVTLDGFDVGSARFVQVGADVRLVATVAGERRVIATLETAMVADTAGVRIDDGGLFD